MAVERATARPKHKQADIQRQRQQDRHASLLAMGASPSPVFARVAPEALTNVTNDTAAARWLEVGAVSILSGESFTTRDSAWLQKRLILEHACR